MPEVITVRDLRRQWKPRKERLQKVDPEHSNNVCFHRARNWIRRAEQVTEKADLDVALLNQWTA